MKKIFKLFEERGDLGEWALGFAFIFILLGFVLLSFPEIERFFSAHQLLFYVIFFSPLCLTVSYILFSIAAAMIGYLLQEYRKLRSQGMPLLKIILRIILIFCTILLGLGVFFYLNFLEF